MPFVMVGLMQSFASGQSPVCYSLGDAGPIGIVVDQACLTEVTSSRIGGFCVGLPCAGLSDRHRSLTGIVSTIKQTYFTLPPTGTMPPRRPYQAFQMPYYARPYNASDDRAINPPSYSDGLFEAASLEVQSQLPEGTNLEYAVAPGRFWPTR